MSTYCDIDDVERVLGRNSVITIDGTGMPTTADVDEFIAEESAFIDGCLISLQYTTPVTGVNDLVLLRRLSSIFTALRVWDTQFSRNQDDARITGWRNERDMFKKMVKYGTFKLIDQEKDDVSGSLLISNLQLYDFDSSDGGW